MDLGSHLVTHEIHTNLVRRTLVWGPRKKLVHIAGSGFSDGFAVKYADNTQKITCINIICYHSATRHETSETNLKNVPTFNLKSSAFLAFTCLLHCSIRVFI